MNATQNTLVTLLNTKKVVKNETVNVYLKIKGTNLVLIDAPFETSKFEGGLRDLAIIVNRITKPFKDAPQNICQLLIKISDDESILFSFDAGKFSINLHTIINSFVQRRLVCNNTDKVLAKELKNEILEFFNTNIQGFIKTLQFLDYIDTKPLHEITTDLMSVNLLKTIEDAK